MAANNVTVPGFRERLGWVQRRYYFSVGHFWGIPWGGRRPPGGVYLSRGTKDFFCPAGTPVIWPGSGAPTSSTHQRHDTDS